MGSQGVDQSRGAESLRSPVLGAGPTEEVWVPGVFMLRYWRLKLLYSFDKRADEINCPFYKIF